MLPSPLLFFSFLFRLNSRPCMADPNSLPRKWTREPFRTYRSRALILNDGGFNWDICITRACISVLLLGNQWRGVVISKFAAATAYFLLARPKSMAWSIVRTWIGNRMYRSIGVLCFWTDKRTLIILKQHWKANSFMFIANQKPFLLYSFVAMPTTS